jgi:hypothetical protein
MVHNMARDRPSRTQAENLGQTILVVGLPEVVNRSETCSGDAGQFHPGGVSQQAHEGSVVVLGRVQVSRGIQKNVQDAITDGSPAHIWARV